MRLTVIYQDAARPALARIRATDKEAFRRAASAILALADDPYPAGAVPWGGSGILRLHEGDIRITYEVDEDAGAVYILSVALIS